MNAIKIEINLDAVNAMKADELKDHLSFAMQCADVLNGHISGVKSKLMYLSASSFAAKWPFKEGQLVKVTYKYCGGTYDEIGFFLRFGKSSHHVFYDEPYLVLLNVKKDGTKGKRTTDILAKRITNIEPYEIPYVNKE